MSWLSQLTFERSINKSNVLLVITEDPKRYQELLSSIDELFKDYRNIYVASLQAPLVEAIKGDPVPETMKTAPFSFFYQKLTSDSTVVIFHWVVTKQHAQKIGDFLLLVAQHPRVYRPCPTCQPSTVIVFAFSESLFPQEALRFFSVVEVEPSTAEERRSLLERIVELAKERGYQVEARLEEAVAASAGLTLHDVETAAIAAIRSRRPIDASAFSSYKQELLRRYGLEYVEPKRGFESVGGYDYLKRFLEENVILFYREPQLAEAYGLTPPRGLLLFGPPGTGKTWLTKALAKEMGLPMVKLSAADILRGIVGESEQRAKKIARIVESMAPIVVFIDEADQLFRSRDTTLATDSGVSQRVQNILLEWLGDEDRRSFIVMATNYLQQFDFAAVRAGRIDFATPVLLPDMKAREQILRLHFEVLAKPRVPVEVSYSDVARVTAGYTAAELAEVARKAKLLAAKARAPAVTTEHALEAVHRIRVPVNERAKLVAEMLEQARKQSTVVVPTELLEAAEAALRELSRSETTVFERL